MLNLRIMQELIYMPYRAVRYPVSIYISNCDRIKKNGSLILRQDPYLDALTEKFDNSLSINRNGTAVQDSWKKCL
jgi:hypothetical protein